MPGRALRLVQVFLKTAFEDPSTLCTGNIATGVQVRELLGGTVVAETDNNGLLASARDPSFVQELEQPRYTRTTAKPPGKAPVASTLLQ